MAAVRTVIWDLDGTLLNSFAIYSELLMETAALHGYALPTPDVLRANFHGSLEDSIGQTLGLQSAEKLQAVVRDFLALQDKAYTVVEDHLFADALEYMAKAHAAGARNVLVTNRDHVGRLRASPRHIVASTTLHTYIDTVICGDDSEHRKPDPQVLGRLRAELEPGRTLVIGDQFVDAQFAYNLGARGMLVTHGEAPTNLHMLDFDWQRDLVVVDSLREMGL